MQIGKQVLWIEDGTRTEYHDLLGPIYVAGYDLTLATNVTDAIEQYRTRHFDALIFDIRLPPGSDRDWIGIYNGHGGNPAAARLGLELLEMLFDPEKVSMIDVHRPEWLKPSRCAVFSVEADDVREAVKALGINKCLEKRAGGSRRRVVELIEETLNSSE